MSEEVIVKTLENTDLNQLRYEIKSKIDYTIDEKDTDARLQLVREIIEENDDYFVEYFSSTPKGDGLKQESAPKRKFIGYAFSNAEREYQDLTDNLEQLDKKNKKIQKELGTLLDLRDRKFPNEFEAFILNPDDEKSFKRLAKKYAEEIYEEFPNTKMDNKSEFRYFTPFIGTANEVNMKQPNSGLKRTSEFDPMCSMLEQMARYIALDNISGRTQEDRDKKTETIKDNSEIDTRMKPDKFKSRRVEMRKSDLEYSELEFPKGEHESKLPKFLVVNREESREETENKMRMTLSRMDNALGLLRHKENDERIDPRERYKIRRWIGDIKNNQIEIKKSQHRYIDLRMLLKSSTIVDFNRDTGYIDVDGEYKHISYNMIDFKDEKHIAGLIKHYHLIADCKDNFNSDMYWIISLLHVLINKSNMTSTQKKILRWYLIDDSPIEADRQSEQHKEKYGERESVDTILNRLRKVGVDWDAPRISRFLTKTAPKMIVEKYKDSMEDWIYLNKLRGEYKYCPKCEVVKLISRFGKSNNRIDGLQGHCKDCRNVHKK